MTNGMISISPSLTSLTYVVIFQLHLHMAYIYCSLFDMQELGRYTIRFQFEAVYWQISWCHRGFNCLVYMQLSANFMVVITILFAHTSFLWATCCLICFIPIVKPFLTHWSWLRVMAFIERGNGAHGGCDRSAPDPTSDIFRGPCTPILWFVFPIRLMFCLFDCFESDEQFFSYLATFTNAGDRAANLDLCLALKAFSSEGSFTCHIYCDTGPPFFKVISERPVTFWMSCSWRRSNLYLF
jgi:hypothetical protein